MNLPNLSRRKLVQALVAGAAASASVYYWKAFVNDQQVLDIKLPSNPDFDAPSLQLFIALSKLVTLRESLDQTMAEKMYLLFIDEPWGSHHISSSYQQILELAGIPPYTEPPISTSSRKQLGEGQAWFTYHLLTTWYLGIYHHESRSTERVGYEHSLMYDATRGVLPVPYIESTGFGAWATYPVDNA